MRITQNIIISIYWWIFHIHCQFLCVHTGCVYVVKNKRRQKCKEVNASYPKLFHSWGMNGNMRSISIIWNTFLFSGYCSTGEATKSGFILCALQVKIGIQWIKLSLAENYKRWLWKPDKMAHRDRSTRKV